MVELEHQHPHRDSYLFYHHNQLLRLTFHSIATLMYLSLCPCMQDLLSKHQVSIEVQTL